MAEASQEHNGGKTRETLKSVHKFVLRCLEAAATHDTPASESYPRLCYTKLRTYPYIRTIIALIATDLDHAY